MTSVQQFNRLNGRVVSRSEIEKILKTAKQENATDVVYRISKILNENPNTQRFDISISEFEIEPVSQEFLAGVHFEETEEEISGLNGLAAAVSSQQIYEMITKKMIEAMRSASGKDYKKTWHGKKVYTIPYNFVTKKPYTGTNHCIINMLYRNQPYENPYFLTFNQIQKLKGKIKKGAKSFPIIYYTNLYIVKKEGKTIFGAYKRSKIDDFLKKNNLDDDAVRKLPILKYYGVYNGSDIEGIDFKLDEAKIVSVQNEEDENPYGDSIVKHYETCPEIRHGGDGAYYSPSKDFVQMPEKEAFITSNDYFRTLFHELAHSTGHPKRLNREMGGKFGSKKYAFEELIAEFTAVFVSAHAGIIWYNDKNHAEYLKNWSRVIGEMEKDSKFIVRAAAQAQRATDYILNFDKNGEPAFYKEIFKKEGKKKKTHSTEKNKRYGKVTKREKKPKEKKYTTAYFEKDLDYDTLYKAYHWNSFSPDKNAERDIKEWAKTMVELYQTDIQKAKQNQVQDTYEASFDKWHQKLLAVKKQIISQQSKIISTAVTGGAGVKSSQIRKSETAWKNINQLNDTFSENLEKAKKELFKIAKNTPDDQYEAGEVIKSTDKHADSKIQQKIQELQQQVERIKKSEKELKKASENQWKTILINNGFSEKETEEIIDFYQRYGYFYFGKSTTNLNAEIRRLKERLAHTEKIKDNAQENGEDKITEFEGGKIVQNTEEMRLQIHFNEVPSAEIREALKKKAFKWSPKNKVWQRVLTREAISVVDGFFKNGLFKKKVDEIEKALEKEPKGTHLLLEDTAKKFKISKKETYAFYDKYRLSKSFEEYAVSERDLPTFEAFFGTGLNQRFFISVKEKGNWFNFKNNDFSREIIDYIEKRRKWNKYTKYGLSAPQLSLTTDDFKKMSVPELRAFTLQYYLTHLKGKKVALKNFIKEVVFTTKAGRKIAHGEAMYKEKAVVIEHLEELIKNSTYNNWGDRKPNDHKEILGYLNFKSKLTIDGEKRHIRISFIFNKDRELKLKSYDVGKKKSGKVSQGVLPSAEETLPLSDRKITKKSEKTKQKDKNLGLSAPETFSEEIKTPSTITNERNLAQKMASRPTQWEFFQIDNPQMANFLGKVEKKSKDSVVITLTGGQGSGKTRFAFQFINDLAQNYKVGHISNEEQPDSSLYYDKVQQYLNENALQNVEPYDVRTLEELEEVIQRNEIIVIDSFQKIKELDPKFEVDKDLRKKYNGKLFLVIFQQTSDGKMRGGSKSQFDGDIILFTEKFDDYRENYVYPDKNRYNSVPANELKYSIFQQKLLKEGETEVISEVLEDNLSFDVV